MNTKIVVSLLLTMLAVLALYQLHQKNVQDSVEFQDGELSQSNSYTFAADDNCFLGSRFLLGQGCDESIFSNNEEIRSQSKSRPVTKIDIDNHIMTSASEISTFVNKKSDSSGSGWFTSSRRQWEYLEKSLNTVNSIAVAMNDNRKHDYYTFNHGGLQLEDYEVESYLNDPREFFRMNGYYYVVGLTTGSRFTGIMNFRSEHSETLKKTWEKVTWKLKILFITITKSKEMTDLQETSDDKTDFHSDLNVTGSTNNIWNKDDLGGSYELYQNTITRDQVQTVTIAKYDTIRQIRAGLSSMTQQNKDILRMYDRINYSYLKKVSMAYGVYTLLRGTVSTHIIEIGAKLDQANLARLHDFKKQIDDRLYQIEDLDDIQKLYDQMISSTHLLDYEIFCVEVEKFVKAITGRTD